MNLCEQETATAVQDLEVRQMELEVQRRRLEQVTHTLYSAFTPLLQPSLLVPSLPLFYVIESFKSYHCFLFFTRH